MIDPGFAQAPQPRRGRRTATFWPYVRDEQTLARPWAPPGWPASSTASAVSRSPTARANVSYDGANHERDDQAPGCQDRRSIADDIPPTEVDDEEGADVLVVGWGSTYGAIAAGVQRVRARGHKVAQAPPGPPQPVPGRPRCGAPALPEGAGPRSQPGTTEPPATGRVPGRHGSRSPRSRGSRSGPLRWRSPSSNRSTQRLLQTNGSADAVGATCRAMT